MKITVVGTGYVGLVSGVCMAEVGNDVLRLDLDAAKINSLLEGGPPIHERRLPEMVSRKVATGRLHFTVSEETAVQHSTVQLNLATRPDCFMRSMRGRHSMARTH